MIDRALQLNVINEYLGTQFEFNEIDKIMFFDNLFLNLQIKYDEERFPGLIFFFNDEKCYLQLDTKSKQRHLYCSHRHIWSIFEREFSMKYDEIQLLIKLRIEKHFKKESVTPCPAQTDGLVDEFFKKESVIPLKISPATFSEMEEHFRMESITPVKSNCLNPNTGIAFQKIKELFNNDPITPTLCVVT